MCLLVTGAQSPYPATAVTTISANTETSGDTYVNSVTGFCVPPSKTKSFTGSSLVFPCTAQDVDTGNVKIYSQDMTLRSSLATGTGVKPIYSALLKMDSLTFAASRYSGSANFASWTLAVSGSVYASTVLSATNTIANYCNGMAEIPGAATVACTDGAGNKVFRLDLSSKAISSRTTLSGTAAAVVQNHYIPSIEAFLIGRLSGSVPIVAASNFAPIKNPSWSSSCLFYLVDNLNDKYLIMFTDDGKLRHFDRTTWTANTDTSC